MTGGPTGEGRIWTHMQPAVDGPRLSQVPNQSSSLLCQQVRERAEAQTATLQGSVNAAFEYIGARWRLGFVNIDP